MALSYNGFFRQQKMLLICSFSSATVSAAQNMPDTKYAFVQSLRFVLKWKIG